MNLAWHLAHTRGYLELGMLDDAAAELDAITPPDDQRPEVLALRVVLLHQKQDWKKLRRLARTLVERQPEDAGWWVDYAFATRRAVSIEQARKILLTAEVRHPAEAVIQFNLACYAAQTGALDEARVRLARAIALDPDTRELARHDPDLAPLRASEVPPPAP